MDNEIKKYVKNLLRSFSKPKDIIIKESLLTLRIHLHGDIGNTSKTIMMKPEFIFFANSLEVNFFDQNSVLLAGGTQDNMQVELELVNLKNRLEVWGKHQINSEEGKNHTRSDILFNHLNVFSSIP